MIFSENEPKNIWRKILYAIALVVAAAILLAIFMAILLTLLLGFYKLSSIVFEFPMIFSTELTKSALTFSAAIGGAMIALYGVHLQKLSAEKKHKIDSAISLKKEIFLEVAEAVSLQHRYLISLSEAVTTEEDRKAMVIEHTKAFFKMQTVATQETIAALLDTNEAWGRVSFDIRLFSPPPTESDGPLDKICDVQRRMIPFMEKMWQFNAIARKEIECEFPNDSEYLAMMEEKFTRARNYFVDLNEEIIKKQNERGVHAVADAE